MMRLGDGDNMKFQALLLLFLRVFCFSMGMKG